MQISCRTRAFLGVALFILFYYSARADEKPMMKAVVAHEYGAPEVLKFEEVPRPEPKEDEALVRVIASSVNPADPLTLSGKYAREFGTHLPLIPGYDIAGVVEKTGANVTKLKVGDAVYGYPTFGGGWADYVTVKEGEVAAKPKSLNFVEAAAVPMGALTAWQALMDVAKLQPGANYSHSRRLRWRGQLCGADRKSAWSACHCDRVDRKPRRPEATRRRRDSGLYKDQI
jgi:Alcohol dehydrogenase GroES-like domain